MKDVVGVEELDQVAVRAGDRLGHRRLLAEVAVATGEAQARVGLRVEVRGVSSRRAVVDNDQLEVLEVLCVDRIEHLLQMRLRLVGGDADADPGRQ